MKSIYGNTSHALFDQDLPFSIKFYEEPFFRKLKWQEARRLVDVEGWQVKAAAYHLGYRHPNDLSRALKETNQE